MEPNNVGIPSFKNMQRVPFEFGTVTVFIYPITIPKVRIKERKLCGATKFILANVTLLLNQGSTAPQYLSPPTFLSQESVIESPVNFSHYRLKYVTDSLTAVPKREGRQRVSKAICLVTKVKSLL